MSILYNTNGRATRHVHNGNAGPASAKCPFCGSPITTKEFREIRQRMEAEEAERLARAEAALQQQFTREAAAQIAKLKREATAREATIRREAASAATAAPAGKLTEAEKAKTAVEAQVKAIRASVEETVTQRLAGQRETLGKQMADAIAAERVKHAEERIKLTEQLADLQRRLEQRSAHAVGEPAEADLHKVIEQAFPTDLVRRVRRGRRGPDVIIEVIHSGAMVGKIVIDSKAHARWSNKFTSKLRDDAVRENAAFAVLSSSIMPAGVRGALHVQDNVIVAPRTSVPAMIGLLRQMIVQAHVLRLSAVSRSEKADRLYEFILSPHANDLFDRFRNASGDLIGLDVKEVEAHHVVWRRRGELIRTVQRVHEDLSAAIESIIGGSVPMAEGVAP